MTTALEKHEPQPSPVLRDAGHGLTMWDKAMLAPVEKQQVALAEYAKRRDNFYRWLCSNLVEEVHYGYPPGTRRPDVSGYKSKPSLYKAGALLICDLLRLRPTYSPETDFWKMLGGQPGTFVVRCDLVSQETGEVMGGGRGLFEAGEKKGMGANSALKMAQKRSLVDAVINTVPVAGDLYSPEDRDVSPPEMRRSTTAQARTSTSKKREQPAVDLLTDAQVARLRQLAASPLATAAMKTHVEELVDRRDRTTAEYAERCIHEWERKIDELEPAERLSNPSAALEQLEMPDEAEDGGDDGGGMAK